MTKVFISGADQGDKIVTISGVEEETFLQGVRYSEPNLYPDLSSRQFWLAAYEIGITKQSVRDLCDDDTLLIVVDESSTFVRNDPDLIVLSQLMGITAEQLDDLWLWASGV